MKGKFERILITGGSGLVGKNIEMVLKEKVAVDNKEYIYLSSKDGNLENYEEAEKIFEKYHPDKVVHLAANVGGLFKNMKNNDKIFISNMRINENMLLLCLRYKVKKCVSCLSTCVFPDKITYPINENQIHLGAPSDTNYGYSYSKRYIELLNRAYNELQRDTLFTSIIPCNIYGKFDNFHPEDCHVIPGLIHKAFLAKQNNTPLIVLGTGKPLRQFIYAADLAQLILKVMDEYDQSDPIILCTDTIDEVSIADIAELIRISAQIPQPLQFDSKFSDGQFKKTADNSKLRKSWPQFQFTPLSIGIDQTVKWFFQNYDTARK